MQISSSYLLYTYCIVPLREDVSIADLPEIGIDGAACELLHYRDFSVILCKLNTSDHNEQTLEEKLKDSGWVARNATNHHEVISFIHEQTQVFPLPFYTLFSSVEKLYEIIDERYDELTHTLAFLADKKAWNLKVYCREQIVEEMVKSERLDEENVSELTPGKKFLLMKKLNQAIHDLVEQREEHFVKTLHEQLEGVSISVHVQKRWNDPEKEKEQMVETMIFNCSYLVPGSNNERFIQLFSSFKETHSNDQAWRIELTGPWPPYHFVKKDQEH